MDNCHKWDQGSQKSIQLKSKYGECSFYLQGLLSFQHLSVLESQDSVDVATRLQDGRLGPIPGRKKIVFSSP
jgi:hypothetical protein